MVFVVIGGAVIAGVIAGAHDDHSDYSDYYDDYHQRREAKRQKAQRELTSAEADLKATETDLRNTLRSIGCVDSLNEETVLKDLQAMENKLELNLKEDKEALDDISKTLQLIAELKTKHK